MRQTMLLIFGLIGLTSIFAQSGNEILLQVEALEEGAEVNIEQEQYAEAERSLNEAIELMPLRASLYYHRSVARFNRENYNGTYVDISKAIRLDPDNPWYYLQQGILLDFARKGEEAIKSFNEGLALLEEGDTTYYDLIAARGAARLGIFDLDGAMVDADIILQYDSTNVGMITQLAIALSFADRAAESLPYFKRALALNPTEVNLIGNVGWGYLSMGRYDESLKWYDLMISLNPKEPLAYSNRGFLKLKMGDLKGAKKDLKKTIKLNPYNSYAYKYRALLFIELKDYEQACEELDMADYYGFTQKYGPSVTELKEQHCQ